MTIYSSGQIGVNMVGLTESKTNHKEFLRLKRNPPHPCLSPVLREHRFLENVLRECNPMSTKLKEALVLEDPCP